MARCWAPIVEVTCPNAGLVGVVFGAEKYAWFNASAASARTSKFSFSCNWKPLYSARSHLLIPSARTLEKYVGKVRTLSASCCAVTV